VSIRSSRVYFRQSSLGIALALLILYFLSGTVFFNGKVALASEEQSLPSMKGNGGWLTQAGKSDPPELGGKVVLFDFWDYTCINCIRTFPHLNYLYKNWKSKVSTVTELQTSLVNAMQGEGASPQVVEDLLQQISVELALAQSYGAQIQMLNERTSDLRTLAILGLNPTDLKRLVLIQLTLAESAAGFLGYSMGAILFPISMNTYVKSGVSYQAIVIALMILVSLLGGYFPASKVYSKTTPSLIYKWRPLEGITREGITHQLPLIIQTDEIQKLDEFLRRRLLSVMESENPNVKVEVKYAKIKPEERLYFYQVNYNLFPFDMVIRLYKEATHFTLQVNIKRNVFVSSEHYRVILECVRKSVLTYNIERT